MRTILVTLHTWREDKDTGYVEAVDSIARRNEHLFEKRVKSQ